MSPASKALVEELVAEAFQSPGLGQSAPLTLSAISLATRRADDAFMPTAEPYNDAIARVVSGLALNDPQDVLTILQCVPAPRLPKQDAQRVDPRPPPTALPPGLSSSRRARPS